MKVLPSQIPTQRSNQLIWVQVSAGQEYMFPNKNNVFLIVEHTESSSNNTDTQLTYLSSKTLAELPLNQRVIDLKAGETVVFKIPQEIYQDDEFAYIKFTGLDVHFLRIATVISDSTPSQVLSPFDYVSPLSELFDFSNTEDSQYLVLI